MRFVTLARSIAAAVGLALLAAPAAAGAQGEPVELPDPADIDVYWGVMTHIVDELAYFAVLDRVAEPVPVLVDDLPARIGVGEAPTSVYEDQLARLEMTEGPLLLAELATRGVSISGRTWDVLWSADAVPVDAEAYLQAYDDALWQWWYAGGRDYGFEAAPLGADRIPAWWTDDGSAPVLEPVHWADDVPPVARSEAESVAVPAAVPQVESDPEGGSNWVLYAVLGGGVGVLLAALLMVTRRGAPGGNAGSPRPEELLESGRRFLAASSVDALGTHVAESAHRLSGAAGAAFITADGTWVAGSAPVFPREVVQQVRSTGKTVSQSGQVLVAVLSGGRVIGVIGVAGPEVDAAVVEQLAPLAGEGLAAMVDRAATEELAFVDALTAVPNRRRFDLDLGDHSQRAAGEGLPVAVAMVDVDHFKTYNDVNGHQEGDEALRTVARLISASLRAEDTVYRYGGEEFAVLLPGADLEAARQVAERIRHAIESHEFPGGPTQPGGKVTVSIGVSTSPPPDGELMLEAADAALYSAKNQGRNRVVLAAGSSPVDN